MVASHRQLGSKLRYARALRSNRRVPAWVYAKTNRKTKAKPLRNWRRNRLQL